jgi:hypothetical protein
MSFKFRAHNLISAVGLCVRGHRRGPPCASAWTCCRSSRVRSAWLGRGQPQPVAGPCCPAVPPTSRAATRPLPRFATSRPYPAPSAAVGLPTTARARHFRIARAHLDVTPVRVSPRPRRPHSALRGDPRVDLPYLLYHHGRRTRTVFPAWWSRLGPLRLAHRFAVKPASQPTPPHLEPCPTELQFLERCLATVSLRPNRASSWTVSFGPPRAKLVAPPISPHLPLPSAHPS